MTRGFNWGILFLMAMPYLVLGSIAGWLAYRYRRALGGRGRKPRLLGLVWTQRGNGH